MAIYPRSILQTLLIASENLFTPILLAWIFILLPGRNKHPLAYALLGGLLLGALALTRSAAWLLIIPWMLVQVILRPPRKGFFFRILICLSVQVLVLSPWANHNQIVLGTPTFLTTTSGINLFIGNNPNATGYWYPWSLDMRLEHPDFFEHTIVEQNRIAADIALNWISKNPGTAIELDLRKWGMIFKDEHSVLDETISGTQISPPWPPGDVLPGEHPLKALNDLLNEVVDISYWFILGFEVIGIIIAFIGWRSIKLPGSVFDQLFLFLTALYFPTVSALFLANTRFHWPTLDALIPFAAFCLFFLSQMNRWSIHRRTSNE